MLPSGNDAAYTLAEYVGYLLTMPEGKRSSKRHRIDLTKVNTNGLVQEFVSEMNKRAYAMGLYNTRFSNPHGLQNALNTSSAKDIVKLCQIVTKNHLFSKIMSTPYYKY
jgi:D-alanyl-D-alanine carboxypeptidase